MCRLTLWPACICYVTLSVAVKASVPKPATGAAGGQIPTGRVTFDDIAVTRVVDDCSVSLYGLLFKESHIKSVVISFQNYTVFGWKEALKITLGAVLLTSM
jgi:hypothetical protein